jgi:HEPN domain-containing protein
MPPDDVRLEDARAWLAKAELDLRAADLELGTPAAGLWGDVAFHAQQAAEKALKAFLALHDEPFRKTHSIEQIGRTCTAIDPGLGEPTQDEAERAPSQWRDGSFWR